jgi:hypothetical protein
MIGMLSLLAASIAAPGQAPDRSSIIVQGERVEKVRAQTYDFVRDLGAFTGDRQTARWLKDVCPRAIGVDADIAARVESQVREVAAAAGARVARPGCTPNFVVAFTSNAASLTQQIMTKDSNAAREVTYAVQSKLKSDGLPVRWWYNTTLTTRDGRPAIASAPVIRNVPLPADGETAVLDQYESGRISTEIVRGIESASIIIDLRLAEGKPLKSLVDYAALVGLSELRLGSSSPYSITSMFDPGSKVRGLTAADKAFLHTLYEMPLDRTAKRQRQQLVDGMVRSQTLQY